MTGLDWADAHEHTARCYWDLDRCAWVCPPPVPPDRERDDDGDRRDER